MVSRRLLPKSEFLSVISPLQTAAGGYYEEIWEVRGHYFVTLIVHCGMFGL